MRAITELKEKKKGQLGNLQGIALSIMIVGIILGATFFVLAEFKDQIEDIGDGSDNSSRDAVNDTIDALTVVPDFLSVIVLVAIVGIIITIVLTVLPGARGGGV